MIAWPPELPAESYSLELPTEPDSFELPAEPDSLELPAEPDTLELPTEPNSLDLPDSDNTSINSELEMSHHEETTRFDGMSASTAADDGIVRDTPELDVDTATLERERTFVQWWLGRFQNCSSLEDLNQDIQDLTSAWLTAARARLMDSDPTEPRRDRPPAGKRKKTRTQNRQQQRARRYRHHKPTEASRVQKRFHQYPRRAMREILGETNEPFSGTVAAAEQYLRDTYERAAPTAEETAIARRFYDECDWSVPSAETQVWLERAPTRDEIEAKLRRASNTAPGMDHLEYRHLRALDRHGVLLEAVLGAVHRLGVPDAWKESRTILIHKKGETNDLSNFRPISLLTTKYKLYSGILASRLRGVDIT